MHAVFGDWPQALSNTVAVAERCDVELSTTQSHLPNFDVPAPFTLNAYFEHVTRDGFARRLATLQGAAERGELKHPIADYEARLAHEIEIIVRMRYPGYFLIVWDFIQYARERGIPVGPGRGSAAGSLSSLRSSPSAILDPAALSSPEAVAPGRRTFLVSAR